MFLSQKQSCIQNKKWNNKNIYKVYKQNPIRDTCDNKEHWVYKCHMLELEHLDDIY